MVSVHTPRPLFLFHHPPSNFPYGTIKYNQVHFCIYFVIHHHNQFDRHVELMRPRKGQAIPSLFPFPPPERARSETTMSSFSPDTTSMYHAPLKSKLCEAFGGRVNNLPVTWRDWEQFLLWDLSTISVLSPLLVSFTCPVLIKSMNWIELGRMMYVLSIGMCLQPSCRERYSAPTSKARPAQEGSKWIELCRMGSTYMDCGRIL